VLKELCNRTALSENALKRVDPKIKYPTSGNLQDKELALAETFKGE
jgi:hypothetical protein